MKPLAFILACLTAGAGAPAAEPPAPVLPAEPVPKAPISAEVKEQLNAAMPKYAPPPPVKKPDPFAPVTDIRQESVARAPEDQKDAAGDPEVLELPKLTVKQQPKPRPRLGGQDLVIGTKAFNAELAKKNTSAFDRNFLNRFSWLGGQSAAERAREEYNAQQKRQFLDDVLTISKAVEQTDPAAAKALKEAAAKP